MSWAPKEQEVKTKPEALVKGITPSQPAPVSSTPAKKAEVQESAPGLFTRLIGWLTGGPASEKKEEAPKVVEETRERGRTNQGDRRGGNRGGRGRRPDNRGEGRQASGESSVPASNLRAPKEDDRAERTPQLRGESGEQTDEGARGNRNRRGRGRNRREDGTDVRTDQTDGIIANGVTAPAVNEAPVQSERRPQTPRPSVDSNRLPEDQTNLQQGAEAQGLTEDDIDQADPERKRRRRRSRRGRRSSEDGTSLDSRDDQAQTDEGFDHVSSNALSGAPVNYVEPGSTPPSGVTTEVAANAVAPVVVDATPSPAAAAAIPAPVIIATPTAVTTSADAVPLAAPVVAAPVVAAPAVSASADVAPTTPVAFTEPAVEVTTQRPEGTVGTPVTTQAASLMPETAPATTQEPATQPVTPHQAAQTPTVMTPSPVVTEAAIVQQSTQPVVEPRQESVVIPSSAPIVVPAARADTATLHAIVQTAGLQWVESDPVRVAQAMANQRVVPVKLGREPKPRAVVSSEPLVQVETRQ